MKETIEGYEGEYMEQSPFALFLLTAVSYLIGSLNASKLLTTFIKKGQDISNIGTKNAGAWNTWMHFGRGYGLGVFGFDAAKGVAVVMGSQAYGFSTIASFAAFIAVVIGHNWPIFFRFRGGKGFATLIGSLFALNPLAALIAVGPTIISVVIRYSGLSPFVFLWTAVLWQYYKTETGTSLLVAALLLTAAFAIKKLQAEWADIKTHHSKLVALKELLLFDRVGSRRAPSLDEVLFPKRKGERSAQIEG